MNPVNTKFKIMVAALVFLVAGFLLGRGCSGRPEPGVTELVSVSDGQAQIWTCSMHPQIRQPKPGQCPICGMDLIPAASPTAEANDQPNQVTLSPAARRLAEIATAPVERRSVAVEIRMVGKVQFDETRLATISPRVPGRIDRLYANFAGMPVKAGDHLADLYSPELISAQQELLQAVKAAGEGAAFTSLLAVTRERLRLWGLTPDQIAEIERSGQVRDRITFYSPIGGIVVQKNVREGMYVDPSMLLFTVADLTQVWVQLEAYESDLALLRYAQEVVFETEAYPGESFKGILTFIDPLLDPTTRTVKVRVTVANAEGRLKPEMFVRAIVRATVTGDGKVVRSDLRGKWICPMHPDVIKDGPAGCPVCGMPVVKAEELGYATPEAGGADRLPLVIPATAPLLTGTRAVVYVAVPGQAGVFEGRDVVLGRRAGDYYLVREGLEEGELVVMNGAFKIDSTLQIQGKTSMMAPATPVTPAVRGAMETPEAFRKQLNGVVDGVLAAGAALAGDRLEDSRTALVRARDALASVDMALLSGDAHVRWMKTLAALYPNLEQMIAAKDLETLRGGFAAFSKAMVQAVREFGPVRPKPLYVIHCPMAFSDKGADWLQAERAVRNVYFGPSMLTCGDVVETLAQETRGHE
jgi:Cu(I)/Ag(I) efflux system membrane fusion protein